MLWTEVVRLPIDTLYLLKQGADKFASSDEKLAPSSLTPLKILNREQQLASLY
jgi:hypothetical protein